MRKEISWISRVRVGIIFSAIFAIMSLIISVLFFIFGGMNDVLAGGHGAEPAGLMGYVAYFITWIVSGSVTGLIGGVVGASVYNVVAGYTGGIVMELRDN